MHCQELDAKENYISKDQQEPEFSMLQNAHDRYPTIDMQCLGMIITTADENTHNMFKRFYMSSCFNSNWNKKCISIKPLVKEG